MQKFKFGLLASIFVFLSFSLHTQARADEPMPTPSQEAHYADPNKIPYSALSSDEREIIDRGEISGDTRVISGLVGTFIGFGLGQAVQGRYWPTGFLITAGEAASVGLLVAGVANCTNNITLFNSTSSGLCDNNHGLLIAGIATLLVFRVWEVLDVWIAPSIVNRRYWSVRDHLQETSSTHFFALPVTDANTGAVNGAKLALQFNF